MKALIKFTMLALVMTGVQAQTNTIRVNLGTSIRPVTHAASGSLYGVTETLPPDIASLVAPLKPRDFAQPARAGVGNQHNNGAGAIPVARRLASTTARVQVNMPDMLPGWPYQWPGQSSWLSQVASFIN